MPTTSKLRKPYRPWETETVTKGAGQFKLRTPRFWQHDLANLMMLDLMVSSIIIPDRKVHTGVLISSTSAIWTEIVNELRSDWSLAYKILARKWEEIIAGAFNVAGYDGLFSLRTAGTMVEMS